jgi:hypothetical protein
VGAAKVLSEGLQMLNPLRNQCTHQDLEGPTGRMNRLLSEVAESQTPNAKSETALFKAQLVF